MLYLLTTVLQANNGLQFVHNLVCFIYDSYKLFSSMLQEYHPDHPQHANISGLQFLSWKTLKHSCHWVSAKILHVHTSTWIMHALVWDDSFMHFKSDLTIFFRCAINLKLIPSATEHHCSSRHGLHHHWYLPVLPEFPVLPGSPCPTTAATVRLQLPKYMLISRKRQSYSSVVTYLIGMVLHWKSRQFAITLGYTFSESLVVLTYKRSVLN